MKSAKIITIEGTDCSGKGTQSKLLLEKLTKDGYKVKMFSFPDYSLPTGKIVGECYLGREGMPSFFPEGSPNVDPLISSLYFAANRREAFLKFLEKELYENEVLILDRYTTSNLGHQGGKGKTEELKNSIYNFIMELEYKLLELPKPNLTIFLHMPYKAIIDLRENREFLDDNEKSEEHLKDAEKSYLNLVEKLGWIYIFCSKIEEYKNKEDLKKPEDINAEIYKIVIEELKKETSIKRKRMTRY